MSGEALVGRLRGGLVVSCQAYPGEPMRDPRTMVQVARAAAAGGAVAVRLQGVDDVALGVIELGVHAPDVPVIGIWKDGSDGVVITPTLDHARAVAAAGAHVVALDGTRRARPDGRTLAKTVRALRAEHDVLVMADCGSLDDALAAADAGCDLIGTTLAGYTGERPRTDGPDLELVAQVAAATHVPVVAEGRISTPAQAAAALVAGATTVCVGTAITHPTTITGWFVDALTGAREEGGRGWRW
ncbi:putative N-acetylmannosamine-6-phosphate 2-epimerase [Actinotalea ferrariae]|uniref:N-acetylmannosamine-6-phosphate 2-epimerase n=1 Tax=Actinotalea ferrariae TaxID=1386098 RepID=UPI001C8CE36C|nr:putative N-acetylmannosamine-6-phosphate 2-epimerase [Actinotalea ferrariae]MBX9244053.1 putative N-acetylmannosamine-6-phosphate 2-epimerase [Actinotalea ferrariae]